MSGSVSKTVALSLSPNAVHERAELSAVENGGVLRLVISGSGPEVRNLQVPILIRSNTSYEINASAQSQSAVVTELRVLRIEPGGKLVAVNAVTSVAAASVVDPSIPFTLLSGPRVSLGGGLNSPENELKVTLLISVSPIVKNGSWTMNLTFQTKAHEQ